MARQKGIIKLTGKVGDLSFYKTKDGYLAREKGGIEGDRIKNDPAFIRTRENGQEFGSAASAGKLLRDSIRVLMQNASDPRVSARVMKMMSNIKNMDGTSPRGERNVGVGIATPGALNLLKGFNFNNRAVMGSVLYKPFTLDVATGEITMTDLNPVNDLRAPSGATHFSLTTAFSKVDFVNGTSSVEISAPLNLPLAGNLPSVTIGPSNVPTGSGTELFYLLIEFFQEVNGEQYSLKNGAFNVLNILEAL